MNELEQLNMARKELDSFQKIIQHDTMIDSNAYQTQLERLRMQQGGSFHAENEIQDDELTEMMRRQLAIEMRIQQLETIAREKGLLEDINLDEIEVEEKKKIDDSDDDEIISQQQTRWQKWKNWFTKKFYSSKKSVEEVQMEKQSVTRTREEATSTYSDLMSNASREELYQLNQQLAENEGMDQIVQLINLYLEGTRYEVGYTEERKRLKAVINAVKTVDETKKEVVKPIVDYLESMTNGTLDMSNVQEEYIKDYTKQKLKDRGNKKKRGRRRNAIIRKFSYWSNQKDTPLFAHEPTVNDLKQHLVSNCYMVASTAALVNINPSLLKDCIKDNGDGTVFVRLYKKEERPVKKTVSEEIEKENKFDNSIEVNEEDIFLDMEFIEDIESMETVYTPYYVKVTKEVPRIGGADALSAGALWMQMIEKAVAFEGRDGGVGYSSLWYGEGGDFLERLLGIPKTSFPVNDENDVETLYDNLLHAQEQKIIYNAGTKNTVGASDGLNAGHAYTVMGAKEINGKKYVLLRNPYSTHSLQYDEEKGSEKITRTGNLLDISSDETYGQFYMEINEFCEKFSHITYTDLKEKLNNG